MLLVASSSLLGPVGTLTSGTLSPVLCVRVGGVYAVCMWRVKVKYCYITGNL